MITKVYYLFEDGNGYFASLVKGDYKGVPVWSVHDVDFQFSTRTCEKWVAELVDNWRAFDYNSPLNHLA